MLTHNANLKTASELTIAGKKTRISQVVAAAKKQQSVSLTEDQNVLNRVELSAATVKQAVDRGDPIYGVTTGFGGMAGQPVPSEQAAASQNNLLSFLATGAGQEISDRHVRAAMFLRANVLMQGCSGVRLEIIQRLARFLQADAVPIVRELGSIGASGDLVPLSTIARAITGQTEFTRIRLDGQIVASKTALEKLELKPIELLPKEGLAIVNGTSFSSAVAANTVFEATNAMAIALGSQAMMMRALLAHENPFASFVHQCKPHPGQVWVAETTKQLLSEGREPTNGHPVQVQDRYSLRCLPQYFGPIVEGMARAHQVVETEMNAVSDNPLIDPDTGEFYQSGNFLGQYVGIAMDDMRRYIGLMAKHLDVQIAALVTPEFSGCLPPSLRGNDQITYNMGLKGLQITGNSIMPMLTYFGNPVVEHFPTHAEQYNQNINGLSWGSAHLAWNAVELFQNYLSVALIFSIQALDLRAKTNFGHFDGRVMLGTAIEPLYAAVCDVLEYKPKPDKPFLFNDCDRWLENDLESIRHDICQGGLVVNAIQPLVDSFADSFLNESS